MDQSRLVKTSKYLSKHLRHQPERLGIILKPGGWVPVDELIAACEKNNFPISRHELDEVVRTNDKQRFSFDETGSLIRANQGHSTPIDLQLQPKSPPPILYHGTPERTVPLILEHGLKKMARHHVHLSPDIETARKVGQRRGKPVVFEIDALAMVDAGYEFYVSDNGVWLVDEVPPHFLRRR